MKKLFSSAVILATMAGLLFTSCEDETSDIGSSDVIENLEEGIMLGSLDEDYTLDATTSYYLNGSFVVNAGATLTIPAGTQIVADNKGTDVYIAVMQDAKININGTADDPVIMSSVDANAGDWGGLTLCGNAITSAGVDAKAEVGGFIYGGNDATDNSGVIKYLVIKGTGAQINDESQYNGVSFYAVGSGTVVENLAVINGADDGVEFFGGSVSVTNLYLENNEDDAIDWTESWNGTVKNSYIQHTISDFSTVVEADKTNANPKLINLTAVSTTGGTALQFKKASGATISGLSLTGYSTSVELKDPDYSENGETASFSNVQIEGETVDPENAYSNPATVDVSGWTWIDAEVVEIVELMGVVTDAVTLDASKAYRLKGSYIVNNGGELTIPAGTRIVADAAGTDVYIAVLMGGKINIYGTADAPVVITSDLALPGEWGGLTICGKAVTTAGVDATAEVGGFKYGGTDSTDNSGIINYLVIKGTGAQINDESQYNGVSLYAVGNGTSISNVAVINGSDDGIEFFGGSVEVSNAYIENCEDDAIDWTEGWNGGIENTYISHTIEDFSTAFEGDKTNNWPVFTNVTAISETGGTALQFKKASGAIITGLFLDGYDTQVELKDPSYSDNGETASFENIQIDGANANNEAAYSATQVDISTWTWKDAN